MSNPSHLWAIGYDDAKRAHEVRDEVFRLAGRRLLTVLDSAIVVRDLEGAITVVRDTATAESSTTSRQLFARLLASLAMSVPPVTEPAVDYLLNAGNHAEL